MSTDTKRILFVEDNSTFAHIVRFHLESAGFDVSVAHDGFEARDLAMQVGFDLVLTDYAMPKMTGADLCRRLRQDRRYQKTPFVLITAYSCDLNLPRLQRELRLAAVITKPFSPVDLVDRVKRCLKRAPDEAAETAAEGTTVAVP